MSKYDFAIIGGGISGLGVAVEAVTLGYTVILLEKNECCRAASGNSLRIIHGGFRYLQSLDFPRLFQSLVDQSKIRERYPEFISNLPCLMPLNKTGLKSQHPVGLAVGLYQLLAKLAGAKIGEIKIATADFIDQNVDLLKGQAQSKALYWTDLVLKDPQAFAEKLKQEVAQASCKIIEQAEVKTLQKNSDGSFKICYLKDGENLQAESRVVINCAGAWVHRIKRYLDLPLNWEQPLWRKAYNLIFSKQFDSRFALGLEGDEQRLLFAVPREAGTSVGTFYVPYEGDPAAVALSVDEIEQRIKQINSVFKRIDLKLSDLTGSDLGVLPMQQNGQLYGSEIVRAHAGYIEIISTKYTTFRSQAKKVIKAAEEYLRS